MSFLKRSWKWRWTDRRERCNFDVDRGRVCWALLSTLLSMIEELLNAKEIRYTIYPNEYDRSEIAKFFHPSFKDNRFLSNIYELPKIWIALAKLRWMINAKAMMQSSWHRLSFNFLYDCGYDFNIYYLYITTVSTAVSNLQEYKCHLLLIGII